MPLTVTLSGVVGAGKSSAAKAIVQGLREAGCTAEYVRFQDFTRVRRGAGGRSRGTAADQAADHREQSARWRDYRRRELTAVLAAGYLWRTILFRLRVRRWPADTVLVFDRYFYDNLVHFRPDRAGFLLRSVVQSIPVPTLAGLLLVKDETVIERRAHYSEAYVRDVVQAYEQLATRIPAMIVTRTDDFAAVAEIAGRMVADVLATIGRRSPWVTS